ncbi:hypothetical protein DESC_600115 [Desulfosarcina cetonica]|nr:hypothetical protein DESC_600115 [Desulfosarcina cetonica]
MHQVIVTVHTLARIARPRVEHRAMGQHGAATVRHGQEVAVAFLALGIVERRIGRLTVLLPVVIVDEEMHDHVLGTVHGLGEEEVEGFVWRGQVAVHAVGHKALGVVYVGGGTPGRHRRLNLVAGGAERRRGGSHHGVIGQAEQGKGNHDPDADQNQGNPKLFHGSPVVAYQIDVGW